MSKESPEDKQDIGDLENLIKENSILSFDPECVRKKSNWSKSSNQYKFDNLSFEPETLLKDIPTHSPKLEALLKKIDELDKADKKKHGKLFKHFIFSDLKSNTYGTKLLAAAFMAKGFTMGYGAALKKLIVKSRSVTSSNRSLTSSKSRSRSKTVSVSSRSAGYDADSDRGDTVAENKSRSRVGGAGASPKPPPKKQKLFQKMELLSDEQLLKSKHENFYLLSSVSVYDQNITVAHKKDILKKFNQRPENVHGDLVRFIIMDSGFKEGIDLFDIKYIHIFEPSTVAADQKQVIGRGTRTCGQKGLEFHPKSGWPLHVYIYDLSIPEELRPTFLGSASAMDLYLKTMNIDVRLFHFAHDLEKTTVLGSVDYELNKNIHSFSIPNDDDEEEGGEFVYGGGRSRTSSRSDSDSDKDDEGEDGLSPIGSSPAGYIGSGPKPKPRKLRIRTDVEPTVINTMSEKPKTHEEMRDFVREHYSEFTWPVVTMENMCEEKEKKGGNSDKVNGGSSEIMKYTPTQNFIKHYFTPANPLKGILLSHSVGTGKTCSAIAAASSTFERDGYTILWVTRTTLKNDIWKNMFDQICNESISDKITNGGLEVPADQKQRMKLLSKSWRVRPMSYKQFSNLVSKQNAFYKTLVKINGQVDPLRKTLLIIDEAHKLYGGGDLSSLERPNMAALHQALMHSYQLSGRDSVKLMLMTATPITQDPMELIKLVNLCKPIDRQIPDHFDEFSQLYLDEMGEFTEKGRGQYLDDIAGHISYLNREKDARQFAQPLIHPVLVPIVDKSGLVAAKKFDKKIVRDIMNSDVSDLIAKIDEKNQELVGELSEIDASTFAFLKEEVCEGIEGGKHLKACEKVVNTNIKRLVAEARIHVKQIRADIKELKDAIAERNSGRKDALALVKGNREALLEEYDEYKGSLLYSMKNKCSMKVTSKATLQEKIKEHPDVAQIDLEIDEQGARIREMQERLKTQIGLYKTRIAYLKKELKTQMTAEEKVALRSSMLEEAKYFHKIVVAKRKYNNKTEKEIKKSIKELEKTRKNKYAAAKNTIKSQIKDEKKKQKQIKKEEVKLRKTLRKQGALKEEIKHDLLKNLTQKYRSKIMEDLVDLDEQMVEAGRAKEEKALAKAAEKERKQAEKMREQAIKAIEKANAKEEARKTKKAQADLKKAEKAEEKARIKAEKAANKTKKNQK
jgi:hypothetical protein